MEWEWAKAWARAARWRLAWRMPGKEPRVGAGASRAERGAFGEAVAARRLRKLGYRQVRRNWRAGRDEIDLVCRDGPVLVFVEVRARDENALVSGAQSVTRKKKRALERACKRYMSRMRRTPRHFRFDIVEVELRVDGSGAARHFRNVPLFGKTYAPAPKPREI